MSDDKCLIDDLIVLGNSCPDIISDQRITVCTAGFSSRFGLVRIYPVPPKSHMKRWNVVEVPLERNPTDTRIESWKIQGSKSEWGTISNKIRLKGKVAENEREALVDKLHSMFGASCVENLNDKQVSLGVIKPEIYGWRLEKREDYKSTAQTRLGQSAPFLTIKNYPLKPVIEYRCPKCRAQNPHKQQIVEWGVFEWMRQHPDKANQVWKNLGMGDSHVDRSFLVGNMAIHRNSFMIISFFRFKSDAD
jgi:hypothetical protein